MSVVTTSSSANAVIGGMNREYHHLDFEIPNGKVKLDYEFQFHPVVREEKVSFPIMGSKRAVLKNEDDDVEDIL